MAVMRIFDWLFVDQLFGTNERSETIFYPNGLWGRGYLVPPDRKPAVRSGVRRLAAMVLTAAFALTVIIPHLLESWLGVTLPLPWIIGGALVAFAAIFWAIIRTLSRLTAGLEPISR